MFSVIKSDVSEMYQQRHCLESGLCKKRLVVVQTHLVLAHGKLVLKELGLLRVVLKTFPKNQSYGQDDLAIYFFKLASPKNSISDASLKNYRKMFRPLRLLGQIFIKILTFCFELSPLFCHKS